MKGYIVFFQTLCRDMLKVLSFPRSDILAFTHFVIKSMLLIIIYQKSFPQSSLIPTVSIPYGVFTKCF